MTNVLYENFILAISYLYLFISFLEPGNHSERPYEINDSGFKTVIGVESCC